MNHIYRSILDTRTGKVIAVAETTSAKGKQSGRAGGIVSSGFVLRSLATCVAIAQGSIAHASPTQGSVVAGDASITHAAGDTTITQASQTASINWQSFDVDVGESVRFVQPNSSSVALNRVLGSDPSNILGSLTANGQVFLINPNGILFGAGAQVNVGGLVASTRNIGDSDFMAGRYHLSGDSNAAISNQGSINADGGYVALLGANVSNQGIIAAKLGSVSLASGNAFTLDFAADGLLNVTVSEGAINALVHNGGLIQADGGQVLLSARSAGDLLQSAVNNTGLVQAQTIENRNGVIKLLGDMHNGTVLAGGTLDASAPTGGDGGFVETSAAHVQFAPDARVTTSAPRGASGLWLIDPVDFTIAASGGDMTGALLSTNLGLGNVLIQSGAGASGVDGDIHVNDTVAWSANRLTLDAYRNININSTMNGSGTASLALEYGQGAVAASNTAMVNVRAPVNLPAGNNFSTLLGSDGVIANYIVITSLGTAGSTTGTDLQGIEGNPTVNYALGSDIDASATSSWNGGAGFTSIGTSTAFTGTFDGLGHVISHLHINRPATNHVGLFSISSNARFQNVGVVDSSVTAMSYVGLLAGNSVGGTYNNVYSSGTVNGVSWVGGLLGLSNGGTINHASSSATVNGTTQLIGGLVGQARFWGSITNSYATGAVNAPTAYYVGGLTGQARFVTVTNSYATGAVTANGAAGGLVGYLDSTTIATSYSTGEVNGDWSLGGLVGTSSGTVTNSYWDTTTSGLGSSAGGTGLTTAQMRNAANFALWDFASTWVNYEGFTNPLLRSFLTPLTVSADSIVTYNGNLQTASGATYSLTPDMSKVFGTLNVTGSGTNVGTYATSASGLYSNQSGYLITYASGALTINPAVLTAAAVAADKTYDGTTTANATLSIISGLIGSETLGLDVAATFNSKDVASANLVTVDSVTLSNGSNGGLASNYVLASGQTASASITPAALSATISASDKVYDGNSIADATLMLDGLIGTETLAVSNTANFNSKDVGAAQLVTVDSVTLSDGANGGLGSNYSLASGQTVVANILPKELTVVGSTALDKIYDGTTIATLTGGSLTGVVANETVQLVEAGNFATADVGSAIAVTAANTLRGEAAANYILVQPIGLSASITAAPAPPVVAEPILPIVPLPILPLDTSYLDALGHVSATAASSTTGSGTPSASIPSATGASIPPSTALTGFAGLDLTVIGSGIHMPENSEPDDRIGAGTSDAGSVP